MVAKIRKIPKDHKGLYLSDPFTHGKQSQLSKEEENEQK
jgi:hypothetical protein